MVVPVPVNMAVLCTLRKIFEYDLEDDTRHNIEANGVVAVFVAVVAVLAGFIHLR